MKSCGVRAGVARVTLCGTWGNASRRSARASRRTRYCIECRCDAASLRAGTCAWALVPSHARTAIDWSEIPGSCGDSSTPPLTRHRRRYADRGEICAGGIRARRYSIRADRVSGNRKPAGRAKLRTLSGKFDNIWRFCSIELTRSARLFAATRSACPFKVTRSVRFGATTNG